MATFLSGPPSSSPCSTSCPLRLLPPPSARGSSKEALERARPSLCIAVLAGETGWKDLTRETGPKEPPSVGLGEAVAGGASSWQLWVTAHDSRSPRPPWVACTKPPSPLSWRARLQGGSDDLGVSPLLCFSGGTRKAKQRGGRRPGPCHMLSLWPRAIACPLWALLSPFVK